MKLSVLAALAAAAYATPYNPAPFSTYNKRQSASNSSAPNLRVDLGYSIYEGFYNTSDGLNEWKGVRFAAPPIGSLRWQAPQPPEYNRSTIIQASGIPDQCPQTYPNFFEPAGYNAAAITENPGSEDCLYLNVFAPENATNLPVLVWIHGGGYGVGNGNQSLGPIIDANNGSFIGVAIQYRLGAFGYLSSDEVHRSGVVNAGLLDQTFALQWVQNYIHLFGGNSSQVTLSGESAGGGSVMMQAMAFGGNLGTTLFSNLIAASPYLPLQYNYNDFVPSQSYYAFAQQAGCLSGVAVGNPSVSQSIFQCLVGKDTETLKNASATVAGSGMFGTWGGFVPVTDGEYIQDLPSKQLLKKKVNGLRILTGNNADEGALFTPQNITTEAAFVTFVQQTFPLFDEDNIAKVLYYYPLNNVSELNAVDFATQGYTGPTALNESSFGTGQQQRADNMYAETTFICPSYWLAEAYSNPSRGRESWKYQYSVPDSVHSADVTAYFGPPAPNQGPDFVKAFMTIWGNFITGNNPSISESIAVGASASNSTNSTASSNATQPNPITSWPNFSPATHYMINLNETGGIPFQHVGVNTFMGIDVNTTELMGPGLRNDITLVDAYSWEGGRGVRCDFWRAMGAVVPE